MDKIFLKRLEAECIIGIFKRERKKKQKVWIDLEIPCHAGRSAKSDTIEDAVNYKRVAKTILKMTAGSRFHLIESLAEALAQRLLADFSLDWVHLSVSKPGAVRFSENVGITITRHRIPSRIRTRGEEWVYLNIGSNRDKRQKVRQVLRILEEEFELGPVSSTYESSPMGSNGGIPFWNLAVALKTALSPKRLKARLHEIERNLGRRRTPNKFAPRTVDLDIVYYGSRVIRRRDQKIPHPDASTAPYILVPMAEIEPHFRHPVLGKTMAEMMGEKLDPRGHFQQVVDTSKTKSPMLI